jgi:hypothetical protein
VSTLQTHNGPLLIGITALQTYIARCAMVWNVQQPKRSLAQSDCSNVTLVNRIDLEPGFIRKSESIICLRFDTSLISENAALTTANDSLLNC